MTEPKKLTGITKSKLEHTCTTHSFGERFHSSTCLACAEDRGASAQHAHSQEEHDKAMEDERRAERERILKLYEDMGCVPEEDSPHYDFWKAIGGESEALKQGTRPEGIKTKEEQGSG